MSIPPIAIVAQACVLPDALNPDALYRLIRERRTAIRSVARDRWEVDPRSRIDSSGRVGTVVSDRGGYVHGFDSVFDPHAFDGRIPDVDKLDPVFLWTLHAACEAFRAVRGSGINGRTSLILGNLSYPSAELVRLSKSYWQQQAGSPSAESKTTFDPRNRFHSSQIATVTANYLQLGGNAYCLDAACASSLYAIKLACDELHRGQADLVLAGGVAAVDDFFIHIGFTALKALSQSGRSLPFGQQADGLVPAEGAVVVGLKRLDDAIAHGDEILGVIRGIGLSNDGSAGGLLSPDSPGQIRAIRQAYKNAAIDPSEISFVECHATGTLLGDGIELASLREVFGTNKPLAIGSLKSNMGHLLAAAGGAGLLKVLAALKHGELLPNADSGPLRSELAAGSLELIQDVRPWKQQTGPRRAAVSAFGFGGCNAHMIVEEWLPTQLNIRAASTPTTSLTTSDQPLAIVGLATQVSTGKDTSDFLSGLLGTVVGDASPQPMQAIQLDARGLRFPPQDLRRALPQQLAVLKVAMDAVRNVQLPKERTGAFVGMQVDSQATRFGINDARTVDSSKDMESGVPSVDSAIVLGSMPNIPANRINIQLDFHGPGFTISADELSGVRALEIAAHALRNNELDCAVVCAVDLCCEPLHEHIAAKVLDASKRTPGDAAVALVLKRQCDAVRDGDTIIAMIEPSSTPTSAEDSTLSQIQSQLTSRFGHAHAASGLLQVAATASALHHNTFPHSGLWPWLKRSCARSATLTIDALGGGRSQVRLSVAAQSTATPIVSDRVPQAHPAIGSKTQSGDVAFVFGSAAAAYPGMGKELLWAFPEVWEQLIQQCPTMAASADWFDPQQISATRTVQQRLHGASLLSQFHVLMAQHILKLTPAAYLGISSGESNALMASGAWSDMGELLQRLETEELFTRHVGGQFESVRTAWGLSPNEPVEWTSFLVRAPLDAVRQALANEPRVHLAMICSPRDCMIAGDAAGCRRVIQRIGTTEAVESDYRLAVHVPELAQVAALWKQVHTLPTTSAVRGRVYGNGPGRDYAPTSEAAAEAILQQAVQTVDFPKIIECAWADDVRVFVELGPRDLCSRWIDEILGEREHLCVSFDHSGRNSLEQVTQAVTRLAAAGVPIDVEVLNARIRSLLCLPQTGASTSSSSTLEFPAHWPLVRLSSRSGDAAGAFSQKVESPVMPSLQAMPRAPQLPSVLDFSDDGFRTAPVAVVERERPQPRSVSHEPSPKLSSAPRTETRLDPRLGRVQQMAELHRQFLEQMNVAHQQFLRLHSQFGSTPIAAKATPSSSRLGFHSERSATVNPASQINVPAAIHAPIQPPPQKQIAPPHTASAQTSANSPKSSNNELSRVWPLQTPRGPKFDRQQLLTHSSGRISEIFGPLFAQQDDFVRQCRMPQPPWLLCERVAGIDAEPGLLGKGTIWTETDIKWDAWYVHNGAISSGTMIEAGQADLMLISWMGADFLNKDRRVYRLLGCRLKYHGEPPRPGDTLRYQIVIDGHARQGDVRLFFFHYDCWVNGEIRLTVRDGQAGFFTDEELRNTSGAILDQTAATAIPANHCVKLPVPDVAPSYSDSQLEAFYLGDLVRCFGSQFKHVGTHVRTPTITSPRQRLLDEVTELDFRGGRNGRGYLKARATVREERCGFQGHFKNDPCMPGTFVFEGCLQAMAFYLTAAGFTLDRDGWRFELVRDEEYNLSCRGQIIPESKELTYEVIVHELQDGTEPTLFAEVICIVDGIRSFHCKRLGLQLKPDWPMYSRPELLSLTSTPGEFATVGDVRGDYQALLACAWGKPSAVFGSMYRVFDGHRRGPRLPGPPYHFMSRIMDITGQPGEVQVGASIVCEYDVPQNDWYYDQAGGPGMPFSVLLEVNLQPCGWLASFTGVPVRAATDLRFRNLDGRGVVHHDVLPDSGPISTKVTLTRSSQFGSISIMHFTTVCHQNNQLVSEFETSFGFFTEQALADQVGVPTDDSARTERTRSSDVQWNLQDATFQNGPGPMLRMVDSVTGFWPKGGKAGKGRIRAEQKIDPSNWYFKAHFFQDPVQPGSLGLQAMLNVLQYFMMQSDQLVDVPNPEFESVRLGDELKWKYRGQVVPTTERVIVELDILEFGHDDRGLYAIAEGFLWADNIRIYQSERFGLRAVPKG
ncbi:MAG: beta-ketoacyl synthase N-terminal-like domain-containing protein [Planctomycetia bacterium]|nr:beta-ketoacyl synthase N-terminal-like domain-containing protein [Planctomycetia bacterium]